MTGPVKFYMKSHKIRLCQGGARERSSLLCNPGTFVEYGMQATPPKAEAETMRGLQVAGGAHRLFPHQHRRPRDLTDEARGVSPSNRSPR